MNKLVNISQLCKIINLIDSKTKQPLNHTIRYWEKEFNQIKPKKINNRRYYSQNDVEMLELIKFLIKDQKISIVGVKQILKNNIKKLDDYDSNSLKVIIQNRFLKKKTKILLEKIKSLRKYGKKISS